MYHGRCLYHNYGICQDDVLASMCHGRCLKNKSHAGGAFVKMKFTVSRYFLLLLWLRKTVNFKDAHKNASPTSQSYALRDVTSRRRLYITPVHRIYLWTQTRTDIPRHVRGRYLYLLKSSSLSLKPLLSSMLMPRSAISASSMCSAFSSTCCWCCFCCSGPAIPAWVMKVIMNDAGNRGQSSKVSCLSLFHSFFFFFTSEPSAHPSLARPGRAASGALRNQNSHVTRRDLRHDITGREINAT